MGDFRVPLQQSQFQFLSTVQEEGKAYLRANVVERRWADDGEADEEYVGLWV